MDQKTNSNNRRTGGRRVRTSVFRKPDAIPNGQKSAKKNFIHHKSNHNDNKGLNTIDLKSTTKLSSVKRRGVKKRINKSISPSQGRKKHITIPKLEDGKLRIIMISGVEEIGRNMFCLEYGDEIVVIDAGIGFATPDTPGIDYTIPNISYLEENKHKVKALIITHGHLDHVGAIPYIIDRIGTPPIYSREFGILLIQKKFDEFPHLPKIDFITAEFGDKSLPVKNSKYFKVEFFGLTHSIPDSTGVIITTPLGEIVSTGDVRVDNIDGVPLPKEIEQYSLFRNRKILLMTMDSTGIPYPGWSISESQVVDTIDKIMKDVQGRLVVATFASQVERIIEFIKSAKKYGKYIVIEGRSMVTNIGIVDHLGLTDLSHVITSDQMEDYPPHKLVVLSTGAQGEEFAALMRISNGTHKYIKLRETDTVILSSSVIPGNEGAVDKLKDNLYRSDAKIITYMDNSVHASGHGKRDELAWIHKQVDYKFFMPVHGHHYRLKMHKEMVEGFGFPSKNVIIAENGSVIEISKDTSTFEIIPEKVPHEIMIVDGTSISDTQDLVVRDRLLLANDGIFVVIVAVDSKTGNLKKSPDLISRGFVYLKENQELLKKARGLVRSIVDDASKKKGPMDVDKVKENISKQLSKLLLQLTEKKPLVIPVVLSV